MRFFSSCPSVRECYCVAVCFLMIWYDIYGLVQERRKSSALTMELRLSWINPSIWCDVMWRDLTWFDVTSSNELRETWSKIGQRDGGLMAAGIKSQPIVTQLGLYLLRRRRLISIGIPIINLRRSSDRLRFIMGIPIPVRRRLLSEKRPWIHL